MESQTETRQPRRRGRSVVGPLLLIGLGILLLLNTLELLPWTVWETLARFWPVILILIGLEIILGRGNPIASILLGVVTVALVLGLAFTAVFAPLGYSFGSANAVIELQSVQVPLEGARAATVNVNFAAGNLRIGALGNDSPSLVEGSLRHTQERDVQTQVDRQGDRAVITVRQNGGVRVGSNVGAETWQLLFNQSVPVDLRVQGGAADAILDLRQLKVANLSTDLGASSVRVTMPEAAGYTRAVLKSGMADLKVTVPQGVAARITTSGGLSSNDIDQQRFPSRGSYYQSPDYDTAQNKIDISIDAGMASVQVR